MKAWLLAGGVLGALLCACNEQQPPAQPGSFDRPTRVAFACFDLEDPDAPRVAALSSCDPGSDEAIENGVVTHALHALVVQSSRGEVAAVDLLNRRTLDSRRDIPGYTFLPVGELPTAIVVPAMASHAEYTYVANAGSRDITVLRTQAFRELGAKDSPTVQTLQLPGGSRDVPYDMVLSPDESALFVSIPQTGRLLRVPIQRCSGAEPAPSDPGEPMSDPDEDAGVSMPAPEPQPCVEGELDANGITEIPLRDSVARAAMDQSPDVPREAYAKMCGYTGAVSNASLPLPELPADAASTQPAPTGLAVDNFCEDKRPCRQRLLVADQALPLIHVVDFAEAKSGTNAIQIPIRTGVPTTAVAVTPRVPVDRSPNPAETQYVYAIDATDGSVLVTENGRLLDVGAAGARRDRISLGGGTTLPVAMSLSVMTPAFDVHGAANQYSEEGSSDDAQPSERDRQFCTDPTHTIRTNLRLRGVFLAVGSTDGSVRVIDVHDMDLAECRSCDRYEAGCTCPGSDNNRCDTCAVENWDPYPVVRHRPRIAVTADRNADTPRLAPVAQPRFVTGNTVVTVRVTGTTSDPVIRGLECVECGEGQVLAFPDENLVASPEDVITDTNGSSSAPCASGSARVCVQNDPWTEVDDWIAVHQGVIPGSRGGQARLAETDGGYELQADGRFCELGVLGADELAGRPGDRLNIVGPLPPDAAIEAAEPHASSRNSSARRSFESDVIAACKRMVSERDNTDLPVPIAFPIRAAYADRLEIGSNLVTRPTGLPREFQNDAQFVNKCFGGLPLSYEVRAGAGYVVLSRNDARFAHDVRAEEGTNHCVRDESLGRTFRARAYPDQPFDNGSVAFQIRGGGTPPRIDTTLILGLVSTTPKTVMNASVSVNTQVVASLPVDLRWSETDDALYMVDVASRGLVQILVDPWPITGVSRSFQ